MFDPIRAWSRRHSSMVSALWLLPVIGYSLLVALSPGGPSGMYGTTGVPGYVLLAVLLVGPLFWRNTRPLTVFAVVAAVSFVQWLVLPYLYPMNLAPLIALYAVAVHRSMSWALATLAIAELGIFLVVLRQGEVTLQSMISGSAIVVAVWIAGLDASTRRRYLASLEERAERAERERDQQARIAAAAERARIARELHDVVAHNVSVMVVQADGAGYVIDSDPEQARQAVRTIARTGREALAEMRRLVGVLRQDGQETADYLPQPGLAQLAEMVAGAGLPARLVVTGAPPDLPEGEQLVIYRITQEALTNALKHGGPQVTAVVAIDYGPDEVSVRVTDDGRGAGAARGADGHGLVGMRERVGMYGGTVWAGPRNGGGFEVRASLPVATARAA